MKKHGRVILAGAGPGDPELLTLKALRALQAAEAVVHDRLVSPEILALAPAGARLISVGKAPRSHPVPQDEINRILVRLAMEGLTVVRLKGGDPFVFGRGSEEALALLEAGIRVEVVPGVTAAQGCAAAVGVPLTHRGLATGVRFVTGHCREDQPLALDWDGMADPDTTLVIYMGAANIERITRELTDAGLPAETPALAISNGCTPRERRLLSRLSRLAADAEAQTFSGPVLFVIGRVVSLYGAQPGLPAPGLPAPACLRLLAEVERVHA